MQFGEQVVKYRTKRGLTQKQLADDVGISITYISLVERGKLVPSARVARLIATVLGIQKWDIPSKKLYNQSALLRRAEHSPVLAKLLQRLSGGDGTTQQIRQWLESLD